MPHRHVRFEHYVYLVRGTMSPGEMLERLHQHVLEGCQECRRAWEHLVAGQRTDLRDLLAGETGPIPFDSTPPPPAPEGQASNYESAFSKAADTVREAGRRLTQEKRHARSKLKALLVLPPTERLDAVYRSRKRFRVPALAHLLVEEARERVRSSTKEAYELLDLAYQVLLWIPGGLGSDWGRALDVRIEAHRANVFRVAGDLAEADNRFRALRHQLLLDPLADPLVEAEVASLEASLRWEQARHEEANELLAEAVLIYQEVGEREGLARVLLKRASLEQDRGRHEEALADLARARELVDPQKQSFLYLFIAVGTAPILLDLGRYAEAERVLLDAEEAFESAAEPWWALRLRGLQGRAALGQDDLDRAARLLEDAREGFLTQELPQDTANVSLDLALVYLHQGRTADVRRVCSEIAPLFRALGVERDALATLALFQRATTADAAALAQVASLRQQLQSARARPAARPS